MRWACLVLGMIICLRLSFYKNKLFSAKFAHHETGGAVGLIDLASPTIDLKSSGGIFKGKASLEEGKNILSRARDHGI